MSSTTAAPRVPPARVADARGVPTQLETMTDKNRAMYERYGFEVVGQISVEGCEDPWYTMIREYRADRQAVRR